MKKLLRYLAVAIMAMSLTTGIVRAASIDTTGPHSDNEIKFENDADFDIDNDNDVKVDADVDQDADSGDAKVEDNTTGEDATTGDADNSATLGADVSVDNSGCGCPNGDGGADWGDASIENTGPDSYNEIKFENKLDVDVDNDNDIDVYFDVDQDADSGDAKVEHNTTGGGASSGDASNTFNGEVSVSVNN